MVIIEGFGGGCGAFDTSVLGSCSLSSSGLCPCANLLGPCNTVLSLLSLYCLPCSVPALCAACLHSYTFSYFWIPISAVIASDIIWFCCLLVLLYISCIYALYVPSDQLMSSQVHGSQNSTDHNMGYGGLHTRRLRLHRCVCVEGNCAEIYEKPATKTPFKKIMHTIFFVNGSMFMRADKH